MQITRHTDYALRLLMYLGLRRDKTRATVREAAAALGVSENHLFKVAASLGELGYLTLHRGRGGGIELAEEPAALCVGELFRRLEHSALVECLGPDGGQCVFTPSCVLTGALRSAHEAFCAELDRWTLADLLKGPVALRQAVGLDRRGALPRGAE